MVDQKRFALGKEPFIRKADFKQGSTGIIMRDYMIALMPLILFAWIKNGLYPFINGNQGFFQMLYPLIFVIIGGATSFVIEGLFYLVFMKEKNISTKLKQSFPIIPGVLLAMVLPVNTPIWILIIGCIFGVVVIKLLFGGFGYNIFNPALAGYLFVMTAFYGVITKSGGFPNASEVEILSGATPLTYFFNNPSVPFDQMLNSYGGILPFFIGTIPGSMAETSALLCLISMGYLIARKVINWKIPVIYISTVFIFAFIIGATQGYAGNINYPLFHVFSGGLMFGAVFMATEPVTSPRTPNGKIVFALFLGVLTIMLRYLSNLSEGVAASILFMNLFAPMIDRVFAKVRVNENARKMVLSYVYVGVILLAIVGFTLLQLGV